MSAARPPQAVVLPQGRTGPIEKLWPRDAGSVQGVQLMDWPAAEGDDSGTGSGQGAPNLPVRQTILVVDDEPDVRTVVRRMLEPRGYAVLDTGDPRQAQRIASQRPVDLLLTDVVMPLMRGTELAQRFRAVAPSAKVLLMSAYAVAEIAQSGHPFIPKPFTPEVLARKVQQVLDRQLRSPFARRPQAHAVA
jgi:CheY-like chemotaxis protein